MMLQIMSLADSRINQRTVECVRSCTVSLNDRRIDIVLVGGDKVQIRGSEFDLVDTLQAVQVPGEK